MRIYPVTPPARAVIAPEPAAASTSSLPQYKVRNRDGSEVIIPTAEVLAQRIIGGEIGPDTVIFDAGRGTWCRAGEAPLVRFIVTEAGRERPELLMGWPMEVDSRRSATANTALPQTELFTATRQAEAWPTVREIDPMAASASPPVNGADADLKATPRSQVDTPKAEVRAAPRPVSSAEVASPAAPKPVSTATVSSPLAARSEVRVDWEHIPVTLDLPTQTSPAAGVRVTRKMRTRIFVSSLVGGVAATVALGVVLQSETSALDVPDGQVSVIQNPAPYTFAEGPQGVSSPPPPPPVQRELAPATADFPKLEPPRASRAIEIPTAPFLGEVQLAGAGSIATNSSSPLVTLPTPPRPNRANEDAPPPAPFTQPRVSNASRVQQALEREYPIGLRELGIGGRVEISFYINEQGVVERFETKQGSGNADLDRAALRVAEVFQFTPALRGAEQVPVWFSIVIGFGNGSRATTGNPTNVVAASANPANGANQPVAAQFDVMPQVRNANRVRQALDREYPIGLRASGVGGLVEMWFYISDRGVVDRFQLKKSSGNADLDQAALRVAPVYQFSPGMRGNAQAAGWVSVGVAFAGGSGGGGK